MQSIDELAREIIDLTPSQQLAMSGTQSLKDTMDEIGATARARGLTSELLDEILEEN